MKIGKNGEKIIQKIVDQVNINGDLLLKINEYAENIRTDLMLNMKPGSDVILENIPGECSLNLAPAEIIFRMATSIVEVKEKKK